MTHVPGNHVAKPTGSADPVPFAARDTNSVFPVRCGSNGVAVQADDVVEYFGIHGVAQRNTMPAIVRYDVVANDVVGSVGHAYSVAAIAQVACSIAVDTDIIADHFVRRVDNQYADIFVAIIAVSRDDISRTCCESADPVLPAVNDNALLIAVTDQVAPRRAYVVSLDLIAVTLQQDPRSGRSQRHGSNRAVEPPGTRDRVTGMFGRAADDRPVANDPESDA